MFNGEIIQEKDRGRTEFSWKLLAEWETYHRAGSLR